MLATLVMSRREEAAEGRGGRMRREENGFDHEIRFCASTPAHTTSGALNLATEESGVIDCV